MAAQFPSMSVSTRFMDTTKQNDSRKKRLGWHRFAGTERKHERCLTKFAPKSYVIIIA